MILETIAKYFRLPDSVQVAILVQEDDYASAGSKVASGTVEVLHGNTTMVSETFDFQHLVYWMENDTAEDLGYFYFFFHHPPVQRNMQVRVSVTLGDGREASQTVGIDATTAEVDANVWQNPALAGRDTINYDKDPTSVPTRPLNGTS